MGQQPPAQWRRPLRWVNSHQLNNGECRGGLTATGSTKGDVEVDQRPPAQQNEVKVNLRPTAQGRQTTKGAKSQTDEGAKSQMDAYA